jgi:hypothetical protein
MSDPNEKGAHDVLSKYNIALDLILKKINMYNKCREIDQNAQ